MGALDSQAAWEARVASYSGIYHYHKLEEASGNPQHDDGSEPPEADFTGTYTAYEVPGPFSGALGIRGNFGANQGAGHFSYPPAFIWEGFFLCEAYPAADTGNGAVILSFANSYIYMDTDGKMGIANGWQYSGGSYTYSGVGSRVAPLDTWCYVAATRYSDDTFDFWYGVVADDDIALEVSWGSAQPRYEPYAHGIMCSLFQDDEAFTWSNVCAYTGTFVIPRLGGFVPHVYRRVLRRSL